MSEEPRQPGPGSLPADPPTPPTPGYGRPAAGRAGSQGFDSKSVDPFDWGIIAAGAVTSLFSLFDYFTYKIEVATFSRTVSTSAWRGVLAPMATLLAVGAAVLLTAHVIGRMRPALPVRLVVLGAFAVASLLLLLALFEIPDNSAAAAAAALGIRVDDGHGIGYWVSLLAVLAGTGLALKRFTDTGGTLPTRS